MFLCVPDLHSHKICLKWIKVETCGRLSFLCKVNLILALTNRLCPLPLLLTSRELSKAGSSLTPSLPKSRTHSNHILEQPCLLQGDMPKKINKLKSTNADGS